VSLWRLEGSQRAEPQGAGETDADGRIGDLLNAPLVAGAYRLTFDVGAYFEKKGDTASFLGRVTLDFEVVDATRRYHIRCWCRRTHARAIGDLTTDPERLFEGAGRSSSSSRPRVHLRPVTRWWRERARSRSGCRRRTRLPSSTPIRASVSARPSACPVGAVVQGAGLRPRPHAT